MFHMTNDAGLFHERDQLMRDGWTLSGNVFIRGAKQFLPLYEAKMIQQFDHRLGTYEGQTEAQANVGTLPRLTPEQHDDPGCTILPRYWVADTEVKQRLARRGWDKDWLLGWRDIARSSDERTMICAVLPWSAAGNKLPLACTRHAVDALTACLCSFVLDYVARQKMAGATMNFFIVKQLPLLPPAMYDEQAIEFVRPRVLELSYTATDLASFAVDLGDDGRPFRWDEERRFAMRAELDAAFFHLYGIERDDVDYIMETFPIVKRRDEERYGSYRTKELILRVYDAMAEAARTGVPYQTILDPPPGEGPRHG
jgi:hypothetical protein